MKATIKTHFATKIQASQFNPIEQNDGIEIEVEVKDEKELMEQYEKLQKSIRSKVIKGAMDGVKEFKEARAELVKILEDED
ncbi:MAG: hypothetical protein ACOC3V_03475 [bacterium]